MVDMKVGSYYLNNLGRLVQIVGECEEETPFPYKDGEGCTYTSTGVYLRNENSPNSLVKEVDCHGKDLLPPKFGQLSSDEQKALMGAWVDGKEIECWYDPDKSWSFVAQPTWYSNLIYRVKPIPMTTFEIFTITSSKGAVVEKIIIPVIDGVVQDLTVYIKGRKLT